MRLPTLLLPAICAGASISWNFEGGRLDRVEKIAEQHYRVFVDGQVDQDGRNRQASWYYFRVEGALRATLTLDIAGLPGEYNYKPNRGAITADTPPVISYDGINWTHVKDFEYDAAEPRLRLRIKAEGRRFWIAHTPPYTLSNLAKLGCAAGVAQRVIGTSVEGRPIVEWIIGSPTAPSTVWLMFRQHAWESGSSWVGEGAVRELLRNAALRQDVQWHILPTADPDGIHHGGVRFNRHGYDLNRNWDTSHPKIPEIEAQRKTILEGPKPALFLTLHNTETSEYLAGPKSELAVRLFKELESTSFEPTRPLEAVAENKQAGRSDVVQRLAAEGLPAFLMEQKIAFNQKLGRRPEVEDRLRFGRELVNAINRAIR